MLQIRYDRSCKLYSVLDERGQVVSWGETRLAAQTEQVQREHPQEWRLVAPFAEVFGGLDGRVVRAAYLLSSDGLQPFDLHVYLVKSQYKPELTYMVDLDDLTCTCDDAMDRGSGGRICKHLIAAMALAGISPERAVVQAENTAHQKRAAQAA